MMGCKGCVGAESGGAAMPADVPESTVWLLSDEGNDDVDVSPRTEGFGIFVSFAFTVNMVVGAGIVGLPYAFYHAGALFSLACLLIATTLAVTTMGYIVEVAGWCEGWVSANEREKDLQNNRSLVWREVPNPEWFHISDRKFELSELCGTFLGIKVAEDSWLRRFADEDGEVHIARKILEFSVVCYSFGSCWLYATVFASSLSLIVPLPLPSRPKVPQCLADCTNRTVDACTGPCVWSVDKCAIDPAMPVYCDQSYHIFLAVFATGMVAMVLAGLSGLKNAQLALSTFALCSLLTMVATCGIASVEDTGAASAWGHLAPTDLRGAGKLVSAALFSQLSHQGVPTLISVTRDRHRQKAIFAGALGYTLCLYSSLCLVTSWYFGPRIAPIVTLNWESYTGGAPDGQPPPWWASALSYCVLLFPVVSVSAAFPLNVIPASETILKAFQPTPAAAAAAAAAAGKPPPPRPFGGGAGTGADGADGAGGGGGGGGGGAAARRAVRVACALGPVACAAAWRDVGRILEFNGLFAFVIAFFTPCLLHLAARRRCVARWGEAAGRTPYWGWASRSWCVAGVLAVSVVLAAATFVQVLRDYLGLA